MENNLSLWSLENGGCRLQSSQNATNKRGEVLRLDAMGLGSFHLDPLVVCGANDRSISIHRPLSAEEPSFTRSQAHGSVRKCPVGFILHCHCSTSTIASSSTATRGSVTLFLALVRSPGYCEDYRLTHIVDDHMIRVWDINNDQDVVCQYRTRSAPISISTHKDMPNVGQSVAPR